MTADATVTSELVGYRSRLTGGWDELLAASGVRADQRLLSEAVEELGLRGMLAARSEMSSLVRDEGILYGGGDARSWAIDPLPIVLGAEEWRRVEKGLEQRSRLLGLLLDDFYGEQRLLSSGALPAEIVWGHSGFLPQACGVSVPGGVWLPIVSADLGRGPDGAWTVLADRTATPAGIGYAMTNRRLTSRVMGDLHHDARPARYRSFFSAMRAGLQQLAPRAGHTPKGVLLWSGVDDATAYEQGFIATLLGYALVEAEDLVLRDGQVWINTPEGRTLVDVILRRVVSDMVDPLEFRSDSQLGIAGLLESTRLGNVVAANPLGSGVTESPALQPYLESLAPQLLGEELSLPSLPSWWCGDAGSLSHVTKKLAKLRIVSIHGESHQGWTLSAAERSELAARIAAEPWAWVGQQPFELSTAPVVADEGLIPNRLVLRAFGAQVNHAHQFLPGGLALMTPHDAAMLAFDGPRLAKDVWVLDAEDIVETWTPTFEGGPVVLRRAAALAPRIADNLLWLGRYSERADANARLLRLALDLALDHGRRPESLGAQVLEAVLATGERITGLPLGSDSIADAHRFIRLAISDRDLKGSVAHAVRRLTAAAHEVPDLMSGDLWQVLSQLEQLVGDAARRRDLTGVLDALVSSTLALAGINNESLTRDVTWAFVDAGVRLERAQRMLSLVGFALGRERAAVVENQLAEAILEMGESLITHRRRSAAGEGPRQPGLGATQLLVADRINPRSVAFQLDRLVDDLRLIGDQRLADRVAAQCGAIVDTDFALFFSTPDRTALAGCFADQRTELREIADELGRVHLTRSAPRRPTLTDWSGAAEGHR
ncbi:circularly permuted type 2 ATP-grasp protein [Tessaracoccus palaemonis]|uniref:Circularly permuted type 2 ATP-grasp protein n=1 Tax=Tessaracoccus palaemonis TaxID=2829499 RepID=A0ABX8SFR6_9ACTN|nr:circularly permuted type 2 ATP-grasp protein [Tessaracoccus palaemonis]QXT62105.1 circularly permuted type 2 ATP-grasp protein [Tessaracoccus palaemonis]